LDSGPDTLDGASNRLAPDVVWNDLNTVGGGAGGGGRSQVFERPAFQNDVRNVVGDAPGHAGHQPERRGGRRGRLLPIPSPT
jgi:hypothetical protein